MYIGCGFFKNSPFFNSILHLRLWTKRLLLTMSLSSTSKPVINLRFESQTMILTIREIASKLHVHEQTLRNWERFGLLKISRIGANRTRIYDSNDLSRCKKILSFSEKGINLKGIKVLLGREKQNRNKTLAVQEKN